MNNRKQKGPPPASPAQKAEAEYYRTVGESLKAAGKHEQAVEPLRKALAIDPSRAEIHFDLAMMARNRPDLGISIEKLNKGIKDKPSLLAAYGNIMDMLRQKRLYKEALLCQAEICRLAPDPYNMMDLGVYHVLTGDKEEGAIVLSRALNMAPKDKVIKGLYSTAMPVADFTAFHPEIREAMLECFRNLYDVNLKVFSYPWIGLMLQDPRFASFREGFMIDTWDGFQAWADGLNEQNAAFLKDSFFLQGLRVLIIVSHPMEKLLTRLRRYICVFNAQLIESGRMALFERLLYPLGEQCFLNEYVFAQDDSELKAVETLAGKTDKISLGIAACYRSFHETMQGRDDMLHALAAGDRAFAQLVKTQFDDPAEENRLKAGLPVFGPLVNEVSRAVRDQYEENPYPRWTTICTVPMPVDDLFSTDAERNLPFRILIAGCGTGRQAIGTAVRYPNAKVTAIDLSRASLAYAKRKARECGLDKRIDFIQADILSMKDWPEDFDIIECSGVLHHMQDPFLGWRTLNDKLKPGGCFKIGLYSESARQPVVQARQFIASHHYPSTPEGIRACRQAIFALPENDPMRFVISGDFFAASLVRDLIFHVQEHRMTLPAIKEMMNKLGLACIRFVTSDPVLIAQYDEMFPQDLNRSNMDNWHALEQKYPKAFFGMYQFWAQKLPNLCK